MPQGCFPVLLITLRSFLILRGGTHSILPKRRNPEYSGFRTFFYPWPPPPQIRDSSSSITPGQSSGILPLGLGSHLWDFPTSTGSGTLPFSVSKAIKMQEEKLCVKWDDNLQERLQTSFGELRDDNDFTDVTLACEDQSIKAHKVILSASSPFFSKLLKAHPHPQPLIYMRGVKAEDLMAMVDFIYLGEANILQEQLGRFLALAEELELKGITNNSTHFENTAVEYRTTVSALKEEYLNQSQQKTPLNKEKMTNKSVSSKVETGEIIKCEGTTPIQAKTKQTAFIDPDTKAKVDSMLIHPGVVDGIGLFGCTECEYKSKILGHMREHIEKHIPGLEYPCQSCDKVMTSSTGFRKHKRFHVKATN